MAIKNLAFNSLSAILAVLVVLSTWISQGVALGLVPVRNRSILAKNLSKKWARMVDVVKKFFSTFKSS